MSSPAPSPLSTDERSAIARLVDAAPPLTESTKSRLSALLRPSTGDAFLDAVRRTLGGAA